MTSWARPGVKCVCVDAQPEDGKNYEGAIFPKEGGIYVIIGHSPLFDGGVRIEGCPNPSWGMDYGWRIDRFRPLITKTQEEDVSMFLELLQKQEEPA